MSAFDAIIVAIAIIRVLLGLAGAIACIAFLVWIVRH